MEKTRSRLPLPEAGFPNSSPRRRKGPTTADSSDRPPLRRLSRRAASVSDSFFFALTKKDFGKLGRKDDLSIPNNIERPKEGQNFLPESTVFVTGGEPYLRAILS